MIDYLGIYKALLESISTVSESDFQSLLDSITKEKSILELREKIGDEKASLYLQDMVQDFINIGLVVGAVTPADGGRLFYLDRLTPQGYLQLQQFEKKSTIEKLKSFAKKDGIAPTPANITKLLATLMWD